MTTTATLPKVSIEQIEMFADDLDPVKAAAIFKEHGALVVRGLTKKYISRIAEDIALAAKTAISLLPQATHHPGLGWTTPDGTLFLPAPEGFGREQQIMVLAYGYQTSAAFLQSVFDEKTLDIVEEIVGPNIEMFMDGQCLYKEPVGGHPKHLHQDSAYFEHRFEGPVATLNYVVETNLDNGALYVVPGSHKLGTLPHVNTFSHLGLDEAEWPWERALPIIGSPGDGIFFHYRTIHGSRENHSDKARPVFINRYRRVDDYVTVSATSAEERETQEARQKEARKNEQRGLMVRGYRAYDPS